MNQSIFWIALAAYGLHILAEFFYDWRNWSTLFPVTYLDFTRVFIWLIIFMLTIDIVEEAGIWSIGLGCLIGFVFHVTHLNGLNRVNPFDGNPASVPLGSMVRTIKINVLQTFIHPRFHPFSKQ
ncbi:bestrophin family protein [Spirosoma aerolatum]|uniref:hypothetical protein n=1 Tax=Spirosoma aerolatum TaxID=1211326 RepID=UPI0009AC672A|nr:hypothetical protein [Spirosoma aerolatum]